VKWDVKFIERHLFGASEALFQTGWFMESITTQVFVVFAIRTRRPIFRSRPHVFLAAMALGVIAVAIALPLLPRGRWLGFVAPPPPLFLVFLIGATSAYLAIVDINKLIDRPLSHPSIIALPHGRGWRGLGDRASRQRII
jgi:Mg2+-importing ATPase